MARKLKIMENEKHPLDDLKNDEITEKREKLEIHTVGPGIWKEMPMIIQEAYRTPNRLDQKRNSSRHIIIRTSNALNKDRILKAVREKGQVTYKGKPIRITPDFSPETMKARRAWTDVIQTLREHKFQPRLEHHNQQTRHFPDQNHC